MGRRKRPRILPKKKLSAWAWVIPIYLVMLKEANVFRGAMSAFFHAALDLVARMRIRLGQLDPNRIVAIGTLLLGIVGVIGLRLTYDSLLESRQAFESTQRPVISVGRKDGTVAEFVVPQDPTLADQNVGIKVYLQNAGQSAALSPKLGLLPMNIIIDGIGAMPSAQPKTPLQKNAFTPLSRYKDRNGNYIGGEDAISICTPVRVRLPLP